MVNGITWEEDMVARLKEAGAKLKQAQDTISQAETEIKYWQEYSNALTKVLELAKQQPELSPNGQGMPDSEHLKRQSTWDSLVDIMTVNKGILVVVDAVTTLVKAGVFTDREHASNVIYSTLYSHKKDVQRMRKGIYRRKQKGIPGLRQAVLDLKVVNPDMTKQDVTDTLLKRGFDFQGKKPKRAVHGIWLSLGYAKKDKGSGQALLNLNSNGGL